MKRRLAVILVMVASMLTIGAGAAAAHAVRMVDDDGLASPGNCNGSGVVPKSINAAILAANPGDRIVVCPGTYSERVVINKSLTLSGDTASISSAQCAAKTGAGNPNNDSIIIGGIDVKADNVKIDHFTVQNAAFTTGGAAPGINVGSPAQNRVTIERNVIQQNLMGVYLNGDRDKVTSNCIRSNNQAGSAAGSGIYSDQGLSNSSITRNTFSGHNNVATNIIGTLKPVWDVNISRNRAINDSTFMVVAVLDVDITWNVSRKALFNGIQVDAPDDAPGLISHDVNVAENDISGCGFSGIQIFGSVGGRIHDNKVQSCVDRGIGIRDNVTGATNNKIDENWLRHNGTYGIEVRSLANNNLFLKNSAKFSGTLDCLDSSVGTKTAGTANTWIKNKGVTSSPSAICTP